MEKVLFIAYQFPPVGGPGVQRSVQLCRHLPALGYQPLVLTIDEDSIKSGKYITDGSLQQLLPADLVIYRTPSHEPVRFVNFMNKTKLFRLFWFVFYPLFWERSARWPKSVFEEAKRIVLEHNIKLVYTTSGPFSSMMLGRKLQRSLNVKWVADMRDPFTDSYAWSFPSKWHWYFARRAERKFINAPDVLVVPTDAMQRLYKERGLRKKKPTVVIYNGN